MVYQTIWQMTDCPQKNESLLPNMFSPNKQSCMLLISGQHQTLCGGRTHCLSAARKAESDPMRESVACCEAILKVLQQGQHQALCMSLMAGGGLSGEGLLYLCVPCNAIPGSQYHHQPCQCPAADALRTWPFLKGVTICSMLSRPMHLPSSILSCSSLSENSGIGGLQARMAALLG